jgi:hypothetical protein
MPHIYASDKDANCIYNDPRFIPLDQLYAMQGKGIFAVEGAEVSGGDAWH